jgi:hypothetical protein
MTEPTIPPASRIIGPYSSWPRRAPRERPVRIVGPYSPWPRETP